MGSELSPLSRMAIEVFVADGQIDAHDEEQLASHFYNLPFTSSPQAKAMQLGNALCDGVISPNDKLDLLSASDRNDLITNVDSKPLQQRIYHLSHNLVGQTDRDRNAILELAERAYAPNANFRLNAMAAAPKIIPHLESPDEQIRKAAERILMSIEPAYALVTLKKATLDPNNSAFLRARTWYFLGGIHRETAQEIFEQTVPTLKDESDFEKRVLNSDKPVVVLPWEDKYSDDYYWRESKAAIYAFAATHSDEVATYVIPISSGVPPYAQEYFLSSRGCVYFFYRGRDEHTHLAYTNSPYAIELLFEENLGIELK